MSDSPLPPTFSVLTLNVWGLKFISKDRTPRIAAIAEYIATHAEATSHPGTGFDIVCLQECWVQKDFDTIKSRCQSVFPYSRYFHTYVSPFFSYLQYPPRLCVGRRSCQLYPELNKLDSVVYLDVISLFGIMALIRCLVFYALYPFSRPNHMALFHVHIILYILYSTWRGNSGALGSGLAIFTRYPIVSAQALPYSLSGLPLAVIAGDFFVNKAAGSVVILHPQLGEVEVWTTHVSTRSFRQHE
jgi:hypothetical protein